MKEFPAMKKADAWTRAIAASQLLTEALMDAKLADEKLRRGEISSLQRDIKLSYVKSAVRNLDAQTDGYLLK